MMAKCSRSSGRESPFPNIDFLYSLRPTRMRLGLENITGLLSSLGEPQKRFKAVLVAGTNGKGSVAAYISSILSSAGWRVGTFYSPHLFRINERITINRREIPSAVLDGYIGRLREYFEESPFTFFEGVTASAILYFMDRGVDIAVFEVGLGGRLDATRLVNAAVTVITGVSIDHSVHLGKTRKAILAEKLGIAREGVPMAANLNTRSLTLQASDYCGRVGAPFVNVRAGTFSRLKKVHPEGTIFTLRTDKHDYGELNSSMIGAVQKVNCATAVKAVETLSEVTSVPLEKHVADGLRKAFIPGRFQVLTDDPRIIMDVSHNEDALVKSLETLRSFSKAEKNILVFGCMDRKELGRFPRLALESAREVFLVPLRQAGSAPAKKLSGLFEEPGGGKSGESGDVTVTRGMGEAVRKARRSARPGDCVLFLGSHHTVEEAVAFL